MDKLPMNSLPNRRSSSRYRLSLDVDIRNTMTGKLLGKLVDIHYQGMMVISSESISSDCLYQIELLPHCPDRPLEAILLGVDCIWSNERDEGAGCWAGLQIIDASETAEKQLTQLIELFGVESE